MIGRQAENGLSWTCLSRKAMHLQQVGQAGQIQVDRQVCQGRPANPTDTGLDVLRKGPRLPGLIIASRVPTIIKDYCNSWINGKRPANRRETKIWLIMVHSVDNFTSELPTWNAMAVKEIGKRRNLWQKLKTFVYKIKYVSTNLYIDINKQTFESTNKKWPNWNLKLKYTQIWCWFFDFGSNGYIFIEACCSMLAWSAQWQALVFSVFSVYINKLHRNTLSSFARS